MCIFGLFNIGFLGQEIKRIIREAREKVCDMSAATKVTSDSTGIFVYSFFFIYLAKYEEALCRDSYSSNGRPSSRVNDIHHRNMYTYCTSLISYNRHRHLQHYRFDSFFSGEFSPNLRLGLCFREDQVASRLVVFWRQETR